MRIVLSLSLAVILFSSCAMAQEYPSWDSAKTQLQEISNSKELSNEQRCEATWDILWAWSKKGNLEARAALLFDIYAIFREFPGRSGDAVSRVRDATIMAVNSVGVTPEKNDFVDPFLQGLNHIDDATSTEKFFQCVDEKHSQECTQIAIETKLVPSFEMYASEIDAFIEQGKKSKCIYEKQ